MATHREKSGSRVRRRDAPSRDGYLMVPGRQAVRFALVHAHDRVEMIWAIRPVEELEIIVEPMVPVHVVDLSTLAQLAGSGVAHGGIVARVRPPKAPANLDELADIARDASGPIVALDGVTDTRNLGAIARSALWFGAPALIVPRRRTAPLAPAALKASAGALVLLPVVRVVNLARTLDILGLAGFWTIAAGHGSGAIAMDSAPRNTPAVLLLGDEGKGIRTQVLRRAEIRVAIEGSCPGLDSLNVSVAAGILLAWLHRSPSLPP